MHLGESFCGIVTNMLDCNILVNKFKLPSSYCVHFQTDTLWKGMNPSSVMG